MSKNAPRAGGERDFGDVSLLNIIGTIPPESLPVASDYATAVRNDILAAGSAAAAPLVRLMSNGGSTETSFVIHDLLRELPVDVAGYAIGKTHSAATTVFCAADERFASPNTIFNIHQDQTTITSAHAQTLHDFARMADIFNKRLAEVIARATRRSVREITGLLKHETYFDAAEAKRLGLIQGIVERATYRPVRTFEVRTEKK